MIASKDMAGDARTLVAVTYVFIGGCVWWLICAAKLKTTALGREPTLVNCVWAVGKGGFTKFSQRYVDTL